MKVVSSPEELALTGCVLSIGAFDGVHLGHQVLLRRMKELAGPSIVITFDPPPKVLFLGTKYLTSLDEKLHYLRVFAPDAVVAIAFDAEYAKTPKEVFLEQLSALEPQAIIVGEDFRFGKDRAGGLDDLSHITPKLEVFGIHRLGEIPVKSSLIRMFLEEGDVAEARRFLGRSYIAKGKVIRGERRGSSIGFPTANLKLPPLKALPLGVFAVKVETSLGDYGGMANVGPRPSFPEAPPSLEVHLFDFSGDLYEETITVSFEHFLRSQRRFSGVGELQAQLKADEARARSLL